VIYFGEATLEEVGHEFDAAMAGAGTVEAAFCVFPYAQGSWKIELSDSEFTRLVQALGCVPSCAVHVASRHAEAARSALSAIAAVMSRFPNSVLDDDFGHLWSVSQVAALNKAQPVEGWYALRQSTDQGVCDASVAAMASSAEWRLATEAKLPRRR
jgi:hypothetical protein